MGTEHLSVFGGSFLLGCVGSGLGWSGGKEGEERGERSEERRGA